MLFLSLSVRVNDLDSIFGIFIEPGLNTTVLSLHVCQPLANIKSSKETIGFPSNVGVSINQRS